jgi:membrane fusion protein
MNDATKTAPSIRELALAETEAVSDGLGLSVRDQERIALQQRLTEALKSRQLLSGLLAGAILCAATFTATASYARKANVSGWLVPDLGLIKATAQAPGFVKRLLVSEGQVIEQGERIAEISLSSETSMGNTGDRTQRSIAAEAEAIKTRSEAQVAKLVAEQAQAQRRIKGLAGELAQAKAQV